MMDTDYLEVTVKNGNNKFVVSTFQTCGVPVSMDSKTMSQEKLILLTLISIKIAYIQKI